MSVFIPPLDLGRFTPSASSIVSWLYQIWKYLEENPIADEADIAAQIANELGASVEQAVSDYIAQNPIESPVTSVNGMIGAVVLAYSNIVGQSSTLPIYRAANDEIGQNDLKTAWNEGCRFAVVDDTNVFVMLRDTINGVDTVTLLSLGGGGGGDSGIQSINTSILPDGNGNVILTGANLPMSSSDNTSIRDKIITMQNETGTIATIINAIYPVGSVYISTAGTNPAVLFNVGVWQQIEDRFLLAAGDVYTAGTTGGEANVQLTIAQMPAHSHEMTNGGSAACVYTTTGVAYSDGFGGGGLWTNSNKATGKPDVTGGSEAHNNMPPYLVVYMWRRVS